MAPDYVRVYNKARPDGRVFTIEWSAAEHMAIFRDLILNFSEKQLAEEAIPITHEQVSDDTLAKMLEWAVEHKDVPKPSDDEPHIRDSGMITPTDWENKYFDDISEQILFELLLLTDYLEVKRLYELACRIVGAMTRGKTAKEIREIFNIENDFGPEESEMIRKETEFAYERDAEENAS
ncbi:Skp1 family, dimerization domain-containing protein [Chaetomium fimeti]|uniref:E3 ubiquitin ligase complex SCF subunit n=1 Tax=Chaetomium fimeti TaxID=1854472 RepID=A0AAE0HAY8_9PEZI|nr:Skp1 family, dimerization domain-containing protein [Chaetomium fimeti]